jgi:hypothetical protein
MAKVTGAPVAMVTNCGLSPIQPTEFGLFLLLVFNVKQGNEADEARAFSEM